jgi:PAS domain S-box-containing protein
LKKILVVDNHPLIIQAMTGFLEAAGHEVVAANDGLSALEILESYTPDVIFVDLIMPNINGEKLCRIIRSNPAMDKTYLVVLSAVAAEKEIDVAAFGADACIAKGPFKQVTEHISHLLARLEKEKEIGPVEILGLEGIHQREITKELLSARRHFEVIINNMTEGVLEITPSGKIIYVNPAAASLLGIREEKILATKFASLFHDIHRTRIAELLQKTPHGFQSVSEDAPLVLQGRQIALQLLPLEDEDSRTIIVIIKDVTEWKQNEEELDIYRHHLEDLVRERNAELLTSNKKLREEVVARQEMEEHLNQAQKMEALSTLAGGMAHDFKNILQVILNHAELARSAAPGDPEARKSLDLILDAGQRAGDLLQQILAFSRRNPQKKKPVRIQETIEETLSLFAGIIPKSIDIRKDIDADCPPVLADPSQVQQVFFNLLANAQQAMRDNGGTLVIGLQEVLIGSEDASREAGLAMGRYAKLTVQDSGPGMEKHILERIFEPYFTTKKPGEGTGLGLAAVHGIVTSHGGTVLVQSTPGQGSIFHVFLPVASPDG